MPKTKQKPYSSMNTAELREATRQFDNPEYHPPALPWGEKQKREQRLANELGRTMKVGRPKIGLGAERIQIALERELRQKIDAFAKQHGMSRSRLLSEAARKFIEAA